MADEKKKESPLSLKRAIMEKDAIIRELRLTLIDSRKQCAELRAKESGE